VKRVEAAHRYDVPVFDRLVLARVIGRAFQGTFVALERELGIDVGTAG
jgi:hypothetical protein